MSTVKFGSEEARQIAESKEPECRIKYTREVVCECYVRAGDRDAALRQFEMTRSYDHDDTQVYVTNRNIYPSSRTTKPELQAEEPVDELTRTHVCRNAQLHCEPLDRRGAVPDGKGHIRRQVCADSNPARPALSTAPRWPRALRKTSSYGNGTRLEYRDTFRL